MANFCRGVRALLSEQCFNKPVVLHTDNGAPMKSQTLRIGHSGLDRNSSGVREGATTSLTHHYWGTAVAESFFASLKKE